MAVKGVYEMTISTHTPHARRDGVIIMASIKDLKFQLTRLMRGVTYVNIANLSTAQNFNSHASCEA